MQRLFVPVVFLLFLASCNKGTVSGNGDIVTKNKRVNSFNELEIKGNFEVVLAKSDSAGLSITTDANLHEEIEIKQEGDVLTVESKKTLKSNHGIEVVVEYQELPVINAGGASTIKSRETITGDKFTLSMAGAGAVKIRVELNELNLNISGAGSVELSGRVKEQAIQMSGAGGLDAQDLISEYTRIDISGVGGAHVNVTEKLDASVSGVGGITYSGNPEEVRRDVSGLGSISKE